MKTLDRQKLEVFNTTQRNPALRDWRGEFAPEFVASRGLHWISQKRILWP